MKFEYDIISFIDRPVSSIHTLLNSQGKEGWELVTVDNGIAYFKRPNQEYISEIIKNQMGTRPIITTEKEYPGGTSIRDIPKDKVDIAVFGKTSDE